MSSSRAFHVARLAVLAVAAIAGMGVRVANWYEPGLGLPPDEVADDYATFALRLVGPAG